MPDYYAEKVNLFVALAPIARTTNIDNPGLQKYANKWRVMQFAAERVGAYNLVGANWYMEEAELVFCGLFEYVCQGLLTGFADADPAVDNMDRFERFMADYPAGNTYQNLVLFAQSTMNDNFMRFNYGERENKKMYGSLEPPIIPLGDLRVPVAMVQGSSDKLADELDVQWLYDQITDQVVYRQEYNLGHLSFSLAKDMTWFQEGVVGVINQYATNVYQ